MDDQISQIRKLQRDKYIDHVKKSGIESVFSESLDTNQTKKCDIANKQENSYIESHTKLSPGINNKEIYDNVDESLYGYANCININEIADIPPKYRFDVYITDNHVLEYSEENISDGNINLHRMMHSVIYEDNSVILFRYCFDIRKIYPDRHKIIELYDNFYFLQPIDHERIVEQMNQIKNQ